MLFYIIAIIVIIDLLNKKVFWGRLFYRIREYIESAISEANMPKARVIHEDTKNTTTPSRQTHIPSDTFTFFSSPMQTSFLSWIKYGLVWLFGLWFIFSSYFIINPGERGIVVVMGTMNDDIYNEWLHLKIPLISNIIKTNIQTQKWESDADSASKDLQSITTRIAVNGRIDEKAVKAIYRDLGGDEMVANKVVQPSVQEAVKSVTAKYTAEELITKRALVSSEIKVLLVEKLSKYGVIVGDVNMVNFNFSADFNQAIEKKVKAEQDAFAEKNKLEMVKYQAQQTIEQAKAQAESIKIQAEAIQSQWGAAYVNLKWVEKRDGKLPTTSLGEWNGLMVNLNK